MFKGMFKSALRGLVFGAALFVGALSIGAGYSATVSLVTAYTGPAGSNPIAFPAALTDINGLLASVNSAIGSINATITNFLSFNQSGEANEMAFLNSGTMVAGTVCSNGVANQCLVVVQPNGRIGYIVVE